MLSKTGAKVTYFCHAGLVKASRGIPSEAVGGGKRGEIQAFTAQSRLRLFRNLAMVDRSAGLPNFVTLTYHKEWPESPKEWKYQLKHLFLQQLVREQGVSGFWKLEPQEREAPHEHLLVWGSDVERLMARVPFLWNEIAGYGSVDHLKWHLGLLGNGNEPCVTQVGSWAYVTSYAGKYFSKPVDWTNVGRFWGKFNAKAIPWGEEITFNVSDKKVMEFMRAMRRFGHMKSRDYKGLSVMCDADQWIWKLMGNKE